MPSILQHWVSDLGLRHQGVLVTAIRGCDGMQKEDVTKPLAREMRGLMLVPFDARELDFDRGFMARFPSASAVSAFDLLARSVDHYPVHYLFHLLHAMEVFGYYHPDPNVRLVYAERYTRLVRRLHLFPESRQMMDARLTEDRFAAGTVEA